MRRKELDERCKRIFDFFCILNEQTPYSHREIPILELMMPKDFHSQMRKRIGDKCDDVIPLLWPILEVSFTLGYAFGQSFEITYPEAKNDIETIQKIIKDKQLLPYLPRERKGGRP